MKYAVEVGAHVMTIEVDDAGVKVDGKVVDARLLGPPGTAQRRIARGRTSRALTAVQGEEPGAWRLAFDGARVDVLVMDERTRVARAAGRSGAAAAGSGTLKAPRPGLVVRVLVAEGDEVTAGQGLVVVEAMKMENELKAGRSGRVAKVHVARGARVEKGSTLLELE